MAGFKYFQLDGPVDVTVELGGTGSGTFEISDEPTFAKIIGVMVDVQGGKRSFSGRLDVGTGVKALYFKFVGTGAVDFHTFELK